MSDIIIRDLATHEEYTAAESIQRTTWGMPDLEIIPAHALHAMQHSGAALLGVIPAKNLSRQSCPAGTGAPLIAQMHQRPQKAIVTVLGTTFGAPINLGLAPAS